MVQKRPEPKARILIVDDEPAARSALNELLRDEGYETHTAADGFKALGVLQEWQADVVITDLRMPGLDGFGLMSKITELQLDIPVIVMTAYGSVESAVEAMHQGAADYITKPINFDHMLLVLQRVLEHQALQQEAKRMREALANQNEGTDSQLIGKTRAFTDLLEVAHQVADSPASILITGEQGCGKESVAGAIHQWSARRNQPFVRLRCASLSEELLEAELFGHAGNTAAGPTPRDGRLVQAEGGSLFIDDVSKVSPALQVKLLRFLQENEFESVGDSALRTANVRVIAATSHDLAAEVRAERFREDLYYRLSVINLRVPTLRERREDIPLLAVHFLRKHSERNRKTITSISERALGVLMNHSWPGNVRQLDAVIERAAILCQSQQLEPRHLPSNIMSNSRDQNEAPRIPGASMAEVEQYVILRTLEDVGGSTSKAAQILGISPRKIQYRLREYHEAAAVAN